MKRCSWKVLSPAAFSATCSIRRYGFLSRVKGKKYFLKHIPRRLDC